VWCNPDVGGLIKTFGAVPVTMPIPDVFSAMDSGILDAMMFAPEAMPQWKIHEVAKNLTLDMDVTSMASAYMINKQKWNELPDNLKKVVESVNKEYPAFLAKMADDLRDSQFEIMKKAGVEFFNFPKAEKEKLSKLAPVYWEEWAKRTKDRDAAMGLISDFQRVRNEIVPQ
jgi:TRAP-type C4-dicarboxylate transport system substrate-binding protein